MEIAVIIPVLNEGDELIDMVKDLMLRNEFREVVLVDASEIQTTTKLAKRMANDLLSDSSTSLTTITSDVACRALQMNKGANACNADVYLFLHADTHLPANASTQIQNALNSEDEGKVWGRFDVCLTDANWLLKVVAVMMNIRSRWTGIATGDQAIFVRSDVFRKIGEFPNQILMEDIEISSRLKRVSAPVCIRNPVATSARRWRKQGVVRTILLMWWLRFRYWLGANPSVLATGYHHAR